MSTLTVKVCEECGEQTAHWDKWLVVSRFDVKHAVTGESVVQSSGDLDFCSQGCIVRYIARSIEHAMDHPGTVQLLQERVEAA